MWRNKVSDVERMTDGPTYALEACGPMLDALGKLRESALAYLRDGELNESEIVTDIMTHISDDLKVLTELLKV